jgi:hypothetical protein
VDGERLALLTFDFCLALLMGGIGRPFPSFRRPTHRYLSLSLSAVYSSPTQVMDFLLASLSDFYRAAGKVIG